MQSVGVVVIPTYAGSGSDRVAALSESFGALGWTVVVVANSAGANAGLTNHCLGHDVEVLDPGSNLGFGGAANRALERPFDCVLIVNDDAVLGPEFDLTPADAVRQLAEAGVGLRSFASELRSSGPPYPTAFGVLARVAGLWGITQRLGRRRTDLSDQFQFFCVLVSAPLWHELGGFDTEHFPLYFEDADLLHRLQESGASADQVVADISHLGSQTTRRTPSALGAHSFGARNFLVRNLGWNPKLANLAISGANLVGAAIGFARGRREVARLQLSLARRPSVFRGLPSYGPTPDDESS